MIVRTPPRKRKADSTAPESPNSDHRLIIFEDLPVPEPSHHQSPSQHMLCTYQCRQMVKSDFFEALNSAEKQARDSKSKLEALTDDFGKSESERKKFREQFLYAEQELAAGKGREQALQDQLMKEVNDSHERLKKQFDQYGELEGKLQNEMNLRKKSETLAAAAEEKTRLLERQLGSLSESTEREKSRLHHELIQMNKEAKLSVSRISANMERMECRAKNAESESRILKEQLEELRTRFKECLHQKNEGEKRLSSLMSQESTSSDSSILVKHLQEELKYYESEVREAKKIRSSHEDIELLKEKYLEEKGRRERAELDLLKLQDFQQSTKKLEDELSGWKSMMEKIPGVSCADDLPRKFAGLQKEVVDGMMKLGETAERLKTLEVDLEAAEVGKQNAEADSIMAKEMLETSKTEVKHIKMMLSSVTEERDWLKNTIEEFKKNKNVEAGGEVVLGNLTQELESSLVKKEQYIKELENIVFIEKEASSRRQSEIKMLTERLNGEAKRIKSLEREGDRLRSEISLLESKLGHGDFSSASTKVLRMVNTLAVDSEAKQTIEALQIKLQETKEKLQAVEELKQSGNSGASVDSYISGKIVQLKEQIATLGKREERYKTVFADRISVFRRACCDMFGYKILMDDHHRADGIPVTRFTLHSIYAQSDDEKLQFEYESGNTNIIASDYTLQPEISRQVDIFIRKMNSIPAFTANLTVESFNKRTLS
ncbi:mitotic spindle checkpoint protein MAD1 [Apium graveolens]|uniref:mitotic spindle checkpoint protein MAD1 n=2 Tax=Apium graveolens TaxID=4045 RepID=UPI003D78C51E